MTAKIPPIQLPPSAWSQQGVNGQGNHTDSPPISPFEAEKSQAVKEIERDLQKLFGMKFGPNDPKPKTPEKPEGKRQYHYESPQARPTPTVTPQKPSPAKPMTGSPLAPNVTMTFDSLQVDSPVERRHREPPTPHHTPKTPELQVQRTALGVLGSAKRRLQF